MIPTFREFVRDGFRLSLLLAPKTLAPWRNVVTVLMFAALNLLATLPFVLLVVDPPRVYNPDSVLTLLANLGVTVVAAGIIARVCRRHEMLLSITGWLLFADILPTLALSLSLWLLADSSYWLLFYALGIGWSLMICLRVALLLSRHPGRGIVAAVLGFLIWVAPWMVTEPPLLMEPDWPQLTESDWIDEFEDSYVANELPLPEHTMYAQPELLATELDSLAPQRPGHPDMYVIGFAGDADEGAFRNEVEFLAELAANRLDAGGRVISLINHTGTADSLPLATVTNLERSLREIGRQMDIEEDILLLYLSSHGSEDHQLYVNQPPLPLRQLRPKRLRRALDESGIRWRVIVVSACYSGGFIKALADPGTLVITAADADSTSFGCGNTANATWFGESFLIDNLNHDPNFRRAFLRARLQIAERESRDDFSPSNPQWDAGDAIGGQLARWLDALPKGRSSDFTPSVPVVDEHRHTGDVLPENPEQDTDRQ